jgi:Cu/Ag efflux pump CusA
MFNARGRDAGAVASDVRSAIQGVPFPLEYHAEVLGEYADRQGAQQRVAIGGIVAIAAIYLLLQAAFQSWRLATLSIVLLPWGLIGGLIAAALLSSGGMLSITSLLGLLAMLGIGARNLIVTIRHYQALEAVGEPFGPALVTSGTMDRFGSVLASVGTTGLVLLPFAVFSGLAGLEVAGPLAIVMIGGLITVALLNLFVVPAAYLRFGRPATPAPRPVLEPVA